MRPLSLAFICALSGCVPLPLGETIYDLPRVQGTLTSDGAPVVGTEVWQVPSRDADACAPARDTATVAVTGDDGAFDLPSVSHRKTWVVIGIMEHFTPHALCFSSGIMTSAPGNTFGSFGYRQIPAEVEATCEVKKSGRVACEIRPAV